MPTEDMQNLRILLITAVSKGFRRLGCTNSLLCLHSFSTKWLLRRLEYLDGPCASRRLLLEYKASKELPQNPEL